MSKNGKKETTDKLEIKYVNLDDLLPFDKNAKRHDIGALIQSFVKHGFKQAMKWEPRLNKGKGGIVAGNGRLEALRMMKHDGQHPPRGVVARNGHWLVPVALGVSAETEKQAMAYAIDDNNLTMLGGDFDHLEIAKMWDEGYVKLLQEADQDFLVSMEREDINALLNAGNFQPVGIDEQGRLDQKKPITCPKCGAEFTPES